MFLRKRTVLLAALLDHSSERCLRSIEADACTRSCQPRSDHGDVAIVGLLSPHAGDFTNTSARYNHTVVEKEVEECA